MNGGRESSSYPDREPSAAAALKQESGGGQGLRADRRRIICKIIHGEPTIPALRDGIAEKYRLAGRGPHEPAGGNRSTKP